METNELKQYLKDVYELESQLFNLYTLKYTLEDLHEEYQEQKDQELTGNETYLGYDENFTIEYDTVKQLRSLRECAEYKGETFAYVDIKQLPQKWQENPTLQSLAKEREIIYKNTSDSWNALRIIEKTTYVVGIILVLILCHFDILKSIIFSIVVCFLINRFFPNNLKKAIDECKKAEENWSKGLTELYEDEVALKSKWNNDRCVYVSDKYKNVIIPAINETEKTLEAIYSKNIIHEKYRNFPTVAQMYEYIDTGRCTELEGPNGAYNLYESELRQNIIINKLDEIISKLDQLNQTMSYMANAIGQTNALVSGICNSLDSIQTNTAIMASNSAITAYNTQCLAYNSDLLRRYS